MPAENRFPSAGNGKGFKEIADYRHSLGLKFGIHIVRGVPRCAVHANLPIKTVPLPAERLRIIFRSAHGIQICMAVKILLLHRNIIIPYLSYMPHGVWISSNAMISA